MISAVVLLWAVPTGWPLPMSKGMDLSLATSSPAPILLVKNGQFPNIKSWVRYQDEFSEFLSSARSNATTCFGNVVYGSDRFVVVNFNDQTVMNSTDGFVWETSTTQVNRKTFLHSLLFLSRIHASTGLIPNLSWWMIGSFFCARRVCTCWCQENGSCHWSINCLPWHTSQHSNSTWEQVNSTHFSPVDVSCFSGVNGTIYVTSNGLSWSQEDTIHSTMSQMDFFAITHNMDDTWVAVGRYPGHQANFIYTAHHKRNKKQK